MRVFTQSYIGIATVALTLLTVGLSIIGGVIHYSPVPFWDMWDAYLDFFVNADASGWHIWWEQHNEHRIVLARILFWMDLAWFQGMGWFLIVANYVLAGASCLLFYACLKEQLTKARHRESLKLLGLLLVSWLFSWAQHENFTWGFQSQFFLAQLVPLATFYFLHKSVTVPMRSGLWLMATCLSGIAALGTMANGVLALPLTFLMSIALRLNWKKSTLLGLLATLTTTIYFYDYQPVVGHGSLRQTISANPFGMIQYVLLYIGSPFYYLIERITVAQELAQLAGAFLILSAVVFAAKALRTPATSSLQLALLVFLLYVGGTAFGTAGGRLMFGLNQALASRYTTPALMAWAALFVLYAPYLAKALSRGRVSALCIVLAVFTLFALMIPRQLTAMLPDSEMQFERKVAALALELRIRDATQIGTIYPSVGSVIAFAKMPIERNLSIFGLPPIQDASERIGRTVTASIPPTCKGHIDQVSVISGERHYVSIEGWIYDERTRSTPTSLQILDEQSTVIGYALTGQRRSDVSAAFTKEAELSGFKGYVLREKIGKQVVLRSDKPSCQFAAFASLPPFSSSTPHLSADLVTVDQSNLVEAGNEWTGADYEKTDTLGLTVFGSLIQSDQDTGSVSLRLRRGAKLFYRSGPTSGNQRLEIDHKKENSVVLPSVKEWTLLNFSMEQLPDTFVATFTDAGTGWGEWSAIAIKE